MNEQEMRELDAWIAEHAFGVKVALHAIPHYTRDPEAFSLIKREVERRGWTWLAIGRGKHSHYFAIWDSAGSSDVWAATTITEELAGCLAFKAALKQ